MFSTSALCPALFNFPIKNSQTLMSGVHEQWSGLGEFFKIGKGGVEKVEPLYISKVVFQFVWIPIRVVLCSFTLFQLSKLYVLLFLSLDQISSELLCHLY